MCMFINKYIFPDKKFVPFLNDLSKVAELSNSCPVFQKYDAMADF